MKKWMFLAVAFLQCTGIFGQAKKKKNIPQKTKEPVVFIVPSVDIGEIDDQSPEFRMAELNTEKPFLQNRVIQLKY